jgi:hypothetical protein
MQNRTNKKDSDRNRIIIVVLLILLIIIAVLFFWNRSEKSGKSSVVVIKKTVSENRDTIVPRIVKDTDTVVQIIKDTVKNTVAVVKPVKKSIDAVKKVDTVTILPDTAKTESPITLDTIATQPDPCESDTTQPWVYPDPSGGRHHEDVSIVFVSDKKAQIQWRFKDAAKWNVYDGNPITISNTSTIEFTAFDSCNNAMEIRSEYYEIIRGESEKYCPDGMEYVKVAEQMFCIDKYEWPNRKGSKPDAFVSKYGASDSCFSKGKRLCTADEWTLACMGPYSWRYPYGQVYEPYACSTHDTTFSVSGSKPECRSFFGVYDMSGNLAEWTDTKAVENRQFYYVKGGFWESGPQSSCLEKRYSYYPQNKHNPVGFRCCSDIVNK